MTHDLKVLIIDDDEDDYFITSNYLEEIDGMNINCTWSYNIDDAQNKLRSNEYDIYLLDYRLGSKTGLELLKEAIEHGAQKPVILLTGKGTPEIDKAAVEHGAYDYLIKSEINSEKLQRSIRYAMERYKNFKKINDNEKKFRLIFENAMNFIFTCNETLLFTNCNPASEYFLGFSPEELIGNPMLNYLEASDRESLTSLIENKKNIRNLNLRFVTKNGEPKTGNLSLSFFDPGDIDPYWQGIIYDETLRAQAEQAKLQSEKLEATYRLVRTLAHEIRNPLTNIGLSVEGLSETASGDTENSLIDIIRRGSKRINDIISDLLHSSKTIEIKPELVDLNKLIREVMEAAQDRIDLKGIHADVRLLDFPVIKTLDKDKFKIAILNLVVNAIEAMDKPHPELSVSLHKMIDSTIIQVRDNGAGIREEELRKLFEPYFTTKKSGMGLGLVSTLNIVKSHKARIEVDSRIGVGTTFRVIFQD